MKKRAKQTRTPLAPPPAHQLADMIASALTRELRELVGKLNSARPVPRRIRRSKRT